ncbi:MAG TPA: Tar ligand binding domain-containing protein, partial [Gammaproteobacteria bacterium]
MFSRLKIGQRLIILIAVQAIILLFVGIISIYGLRTGTESTRELDKAVATSTRLGYIIEPVRTDFVDTVNNLYNGALTWSEAETRLDFARQDFELGWTAFIDSLSADELEFVNSILKPYLGDVKDAMNTLQSIIDTEDTARLEAFALGGVRAAIAPFISSAQASMAEQNLVSNNILYESRQREKSILVITAAAFVVGIFVSSVLGILIFQSIVTPIRAISN